MARCKLCGFESSKDDVWKHLISKHKKEIMDTLEPEDITCKGCGKTFKEIPEPISRTEWVVPLFCKDCAYKFFGFFIQKFPKEKLRLKKKERDG
jgi:predicted Zn-ribbon and HTH transcriptional regulator